MTRQPPRPPPQPLDAEERALAALLPRPHGRAAPGADQDARILAAAQAALHPHPATRRPRRSWIGPTAVAASLVLAVGLAWQLRPPPALPASPAKADASSPDSEVMSARAFEMPPSTPMTQAKPMPAPPPPEAKASAPAGDAAAGSAAPASAPPAAGPPAPPAPAAPVMVSEAAAVPPPPRAAEPVRVQAAPMAKASASASMRERAAASGNIAAETREEAQRAADAATMDAIVVTDADEDVPPATADSPEVRDAWLRRIGELLEQGRTVEARASLAEFRRRYPDASLPAELRKLEP